MAKGTWLFLSMYSRPAGRYDHLPCAPRSCARCLQWGTDRDPRNGDATEDAHTRPVRDNRANQREACKLDQCCEITLRQFPIPKSGKKFPAYLDKTIFSDRQVMSNRYRPGFVSIWDTFVARNEVFLDIYKDKNLYLVQQLRL